MPRKLYPAEQTALDNIRKLSTDIDALIDRFKRAPENIGWAQDSAVEQKLSNLKKLRDALSAFCVVMESYIQNSSDPTSLFDLNTGLVALRKALQPLVMDPQESKTPLLENLEKELDAFLLLLLDKKKSPVFALIRILPVKNLQTALSIAGVSGIARWTLASSSLQSMTLRNRGDAQGIRSYLALYFTILFQQLLTIESRQKVPVYNWYIVKDQLAIDKTMRPETPDFDGAVKEMSLPDANGNKTDLKIAFHGKELVIDRTVRPTDNSKFLTSSLSLRYWDNKPVWQELIEEGENNQELIEKIANKILALDEIDLCAVNSDGNNILHYLINNGKKNLLFLLLDNTSESSKTFRKAKKALLLSKDRQGRTCIDCAAQSDNAILKKILSHRTRVASSMTQMIDIATQIAAIFPFIGTHKTWTNATIYGKTAIVNSLASIFITWLIDQIVKRTGSPPALWMVKAITLCAFKMASDLVMKKTTQLVNDNIPAISGAVKGGAAFATGIATEGAIKVATAMKTGPLLDPVNQANGKEGNATLHRAALSSSENVATLLRETFIDVTVQNADQRQAAYLIAENREKSDSQVFRTISHLKNNGAEFDFDFWYALAKNHPAVISLLHSNDGNKIAKILVLKKSSDLKATMVLHGLAQSPDNQACYKDLLNKLLKHDLHCATRLLSEDTHGNTPLQYAARRGNIAFLQAVQRSFPYNTEFWSRKNQDDKTLLHLVLESLNEKDSVADEEIEFIKFLFYKTSKQELDTKNNRKMLSIRELAMQLKCQPITDLFAPAITAGSSFQSFITGIFTFMKPVVTANMEQKKNRYDLRHVFDNQNFDLLCKNYTNQAREQIVGYITLARKALEKLLPVLRDESLGEIEKSEAYSEFYQVWGEIPPYVRGHLQRALYDVAKRNEDIFSKREWIDNLVSVSTTSDKFSSNDNVVTTSNKSQSEERPYIIHKAGTGVPDNHQGDTLASVIREFEHYSINAGTDDTATGADANGGQQYVQKMIDKLMALAKTHQLPKHIILTGFSRGAAAQIDLANLIHNTFNFDFECDAQGFCQKKTLKPKDKWIKIDMFLIEPASGCIDDKNAGTTTTNIPKCVNTLNILYSNTRTLGKSEVMNVTEVETLDYDPECTTIQALKLNSDHRYLGLTNPDFNQRGTAYFVDALFREFLIKTGCTQDGGTPCAVPEIDKDYVRDNVISATQPLFCDINSNIRLYNQSQDPQDKYNVHFSQQLADYINSSSDFRLKRSPIDPSEKVYHQCLVMLYTKIKKGEYTTSYGGGDKDEISGKKMPANMYIIWGMLNQYFDNVDKYKASDVLEQIRNRAEIACVDTPLLWKQRDEKVDAFYQSLRPKVQH